MRGSEGEREILLCGQDEVKPPARARGSARARRMQTDKESPLLKPEKA